MHLRVAADVPCVLVLDGVRHEGRLVNMSEGGARIRIARRCPAGTRGELSVAAFRLTVPCNVVAGNEDEGHVSVAFAVPIEVAAWRFARHPQPPDESDVDWASAAHRIKETAADISAAAAGPSPVWSREFRHCPGHCLNTFSTFGGYRYGHGPDRLHLHPRPPALCARLPARPPAARRSRSSTSRYWW